MNIKISPQVSSILQRCLCEGTKLTLPGQLARPDYDAVMKILEPLGFKWNRGQKCHLIDGDAGDVVNDAVTCGEIIDRKKAFQFFETPAKLAERMVGLACIKKGQNVLEPSGGNGAIVKAIRLDFMDVNVTTLDIDPVRVDALRKLPGVTVLSGNFLDMDLGQKFERVIMNPPFRAGQDVMHVRHAYETALKKGGRMVAITSPGWTFRTDRRHTDFKAWLDSIDANWEQVPEGTFKASGTDVRTIMININK